MEKIKSLEKIVEELEVAESRLTTSINTLKLEKEEMEKEVEKVAEEKRILVNDNAENAGTQSKIVSAETVEKRKELKDLQQKIADTHTALGKTKKWLSDQRLLAKVTMQKAKQQIAKLVSTTDQTKTTYNNLTNEIQTNKDELARLQDKIACNERNCKTSTVELANLTEKINKAKQELTQIKSSLQKTSELYNSKEYLEAKQIITRAKESNLLHTELKADITQLEEKKETLTKDIEKLGEEKAKTIADRQELTQMRGAVIQKEAEIAQRVSYLKDLYGKLDLPW